MRNVDVTRVCLRPALTIAAVFLISAANVPVAAAQEAQQRNRPMQQSPADRKQQTHQGESSSQADRNDVRDETAEGWLVVKLFGRPGFNGVDVEVNDGSATLSGKVASEQAKQRAVRIANSSWGIYSVRDQLTVDPSVTNKQAPNVSEKTLSQEVARKIAAKVEGAKAGPDWWFDGWRVEGPYNRWSMVVDVNEPGRVTLEGEIPTVDLMKKIVQTAGSVAGVRSVDSELEVENDYYMHRGFGYGPHYRSFYYHPYAPYYAPYGYYYGPYAATPGERAQNNR